MDRRESRQKSRQSDAIRSEKKRAKGDRDTDRDTLRRVRDFIEDEMCRQQCEAPILYGDDILSILNGTERKETKR